MSAILAFLKLIYEQKEKVILGVMIAAFIGASAYQWKAIKDDGKGGNTGGGNSSGGDGKRPSPPVRKPKTFAVPQVTNQHSLDTIVELVLKRDIFKAPGTDRSTPGLGSEKSSEWAKINVKSIFDPTRSGTYIAIIEVDDRRRFVKEGERFGEYEIRRIDGVRNCLTIVRRGSARGGEEREFCEKE